MFEAAFLPSPMARMTVAAPRTMSPPANTPAIRSGMLSSIYDVAPFVELEIRGRWRSAGDWLACRSATTTTSHGKTNSEPGMTTGRRRPEASGSPSSMRTHFRPVTQPLLVAEHFDRRDQELELDALLLGVVDFLGPGGHLVARAAIDDADDSSAPRRLAVRAESMATLPPPTMATRWPWRTGVSARGIGRRPSG